MKVRVKEEACIGCGSCVAVAGDVFEMNDDGIAVVITNNVRGDLEEAILDAIETCPTEAIVKE